MKRAQAEYSTATNTNDVLEAFVSTTSASNTGERTDVSLTKIDRSAYAAAINKAKGQPSQYYVKRETLPKIFLYITPDLNTYTHLKYYSINKRIEDAGAYTNQADVAYRFLPCMCAGLAYYLAMKKAPSLVQQNKLIYEDELKRSIR